jgi:hypothetical protein
VARKFYTKIDPLYDTLSYSTRCKDHRSACNRIQSDLYTLAGMRCGLRVWNDSLYIQPGSVTGEDNDPIVLHRGTHHLNTTAALKQLSERLAV